MPYTPQNPYIPGDPYSYDLKWITEKMKTFEEPQKYADAAADSAEEAKNHANDAKHYSESASNSAADAEASAERVLVEIDSFQPQISQNASDIAVLESRVNSFEQLAEGSTTGDAELIDARIDYAGTVYSNAGNNIRQSDKDILAAARYGEDLAQFNIFDPTTIKGNTFLETTDGSESSNANYWASDFIPVKPDIVYSIYYNGTSDAAARFRVYLYRSDFTYISRVTQTPDIAAFSSIPTTSATAYVRILGQSVNNTAGNQDPFKIIFAEDMRNITPSLLTADQKESFTGKDYIARMNAVKAIKSQDIEHFVLDTAFIDSSGIIVYNNLYKLECYKLPTNAFFKYDSDIFPSTCAFFVNAPAIGDQSHNSVRHSYSSAQAHSGTLCSPYNATWFAFAVNRYYNAGWLHYEKSNNICTSTLTMFNSIGAVGDSFTAGTIFDRDNNRFVRRNSSWPAIVNRKYGVNVANYGSSGATTHEYITRSDGLIALLADVPKDLYILALGLNDVTQGVPVGDISTDIDLSDYTQNADTFIGNYGRIIQQILEHAPTAKIIIMKSLWVRNYPSYTLSTYYSTVNSAIEDLAALFNIPIGETLTEPLFNSNNYYGGWVGAHPTAGIYAAMADAIDHVCGKTILDNPVYFEDYYIA